MENPTLVKMQKSKKGDYLRAIGRRKTSSARVRLWLKKKESGIEVNQKKLNQYFPIFELQKIVQEPLHYLNREKEFYFTIRVSGGGIRGQAEAARLGIARALVSLESRLRKDLKKGGFLTRDSRMKERKKPGLKGARRAPQWAKR